MPLRLGIFLLSDCVEVSHAALRLGSHEQIALSATCSGFQNAPPQPSLSHRNAPVTVASTSLLHSK